jgi:deazaflavin-dependent oxidoreductase (nitroreductase family)
VSTEEIVDPPGGWQRDHVRRYLETDGAAPGAHEWRPGVPSLLLTTRGRRSGRLYRNGLIYGRDGDDYVVVGSKGGSPRHPSWYLNLREHPDVTIQVLGDVMPARARTAEGEERERLWRTMTGVFPAYDEYQAKAGRRIPIVVLEPRAA